MSTLNPLRRLQKRNVSINRIVVDTQETNKTDDRQNTMVSDKAVETVGTEYSHGAVQVDQDILRETWAAVYQVQSEAENEPSKTGTNLFNAYHQLIPGREQRGGLGIGATTGTDVNAMTGTIMDAPASALQTTDIIEGGMTTFLEVVSPLMAALDEVAIIYPCIKVTILAFKTVYALEKQRRETDQRVLVLYIEIKDMMSALLQLKDISDPNHVAPDGTTIEGRMQPLCAAAAMDINECANVCDAYVKKSLLVKTFTSPFWELKLSKFGDLFTKRREQFEFAISTHTTIGIEKANMKLDAVIEQAEGLSEKMKAMILLFQDLATSREKKLTARVEEIGGTVILEDEQAMETLLEEEFLPVDEDPGSRRDDIPFNFVELQQEIKANPEEAIEKNAEIFNRKFEITKEQVVKEITRTLNQEGGRIISAVTAGPYDRIVDPDIYSIWKDMRWRGSVKAKHLVVALRDHYVEKTFGNSGSLTSPDGWAFAYINIGRAYGIQEALDTGASEIVTINEVNSFTESKPSNWSLPHWIAYWTIGWQMTCTMYCVKIEEMFDAMIRLSYKTLPENRQAISDHINQVWLRVAVFVQSIKREEGTKKLRLKFESYVTTEEERIRQNFEKFKYQIDGSDAIRIICGESRPETTLFPMLYLVLERDLQKFSLAQKHVLSTQELVDARTTIDSIIEVAFDRIERLRGIFGEQNLETKDQFEVYAKGLYNVSSAHGHLFPEDQLRNLPDAIPCRDEIIPKPASALLYVLNHPTGKRLEIDLAAYNPPDLTLSPADGVHPVLGVYYGFIYRRGRPTNPMIKLTLNKGKGESTFVATGSHFQDSWYKSFKVTGIWAPPRADGKTPVEFKIIYSPADWGNADLRGLFDPEENSLKGTFEMPNSKFTGEFVFKRDPDFVRFYPAPSAINARKRWEFAATSILDRIRRQVWSSKQILKKLKDGNRFVRLTLRESFYGIDLDRDEEEELFALFPGLYEADARFYASLININGRQKPTFTFIACDNCGDHPTGSRIVCMDCTKPTRNLCSRSECVHSTVTSEDVDGKLHLPNHGMFKVHRFIFYRDMGRIEKTARDTLKSARKKMISQFKEEGDPMPICLACETPVSPPCWCCVECMGEKFICDDCEHKQLAFNNTHTEMHTIVRVSEVFERELSIEERLRCVEEELARMKRS